MLFSGIRQYSLIEGSSDPGGAVIMKAVCTNYGDFCLGGSNNIGYVLESLKWKSVGILKMEKY
jgi:hypothetical protein